MPGEQKAWQIDIAGKRDAARPKAVDALLDALKGRRDILAFKDGDPKKLDAELGLDAPTMIVRVYKKPRVERRRKKDAASKDPEPKKDAKPEIVWEFGKTEGDAVAVKRTAEGQVDRFTVAKSVVEKILPKEGFLAYLDLAFPRTSVGEVTRIELDRGGKETLLKKTGSRWTLGKEKPVSADTGKIEQLLREFAAPPVVRWVKTLDPKEDLAAYGLKSPTREADVLREGRPAFAADDRQRPRPARRRRRQSGARGSRGGGRESGGRPGDEVGPRPSAAARRTTTPSTPRTPAPHRLGLVPAALVHALETIDLRDPALLLAPGYELVAALVGNPGLLAASPLATGILGTADAAAVQEMKVRVRTPVELRTFDFRRDGKGWTDAAGLKEFHVDDARIDQVAQFAASPTAQSLDRDRRRPVAGTEADAGRRQSGDRIDRQGRQDDDADRRGRDSARRLLRAEHGAAGGGVPVAAGPGAADPRRERATSPRNGRRPPGRSDPAVDNAKPAGPSVERTTTRLPAGDRKATRSRDPTAEREGEPRSSAGLPFAPTPKISSV